MLLESVRLLETIPNKKVVTVTKRLWFRVVSCGYSKVRIIHI